MSGTGSMVGVMGVVGLSSHGWYRSYPNGKRDGKTESFCDRFYCHIGRFAPTATKPIFKS